MTRKNAFLTDKKEISLNEYGQENVLHPYDDGLLIKLYVANHFVQSILIDGGSSVNIILLETPKR